MGAFTLAGFVAYSRINDNAHYLHDVVGGAVIGTGYGLGLHYLYKDKNSLIGKTAIVPYGDGIGFSYRTIFKKLGRGHGTKKPHKHIYDSQADRFVVLKKRKSIEMPI